MNAWQARRKAPQNGDVEEISSRDSLSTREELGRKSLIMDLQSARNKKWIRAIALFLVVTFVNQDLIWAQEGSPVWSKGQNGNFALKTQAPASHGAMPIPKDIAVTKEVYNSTNGGGNTIINIQDAHASLAAQDSIVSILDSLVTNYDLKLVAIEGSTGYIDTSLLRTFPDETIRKKTAQYLMRKGKMSAGEFFAITSDKPVALYGIEDNPLYRENVDQFRKVYEINLATKKDMDGLINALNGLKARIYTKDMAALDDNSILHKDGKIAFTDRWQLVKKLADKVSLDYKKYENLSKLVESMEVEKSIKFELANKERDALIDTLTKKITKQSLEELILKSIAFKSGKIYQGEYYQFLQSLAQRSGIDPEPYKDLIAYTDYITLYESIDLLAIFEEVKDFEDAIKEKLFTTPEERKLHDILKCVGFVKDLFELKLNNGDFDYLDKHITVCNAGTIADFIRTSSAKYNIVMEGNYDIGKIFDNAPTALGFYKTAEMRNNAMLSNTIKKMRDDGQSLAALITGGYHTKGLTQLLKEKETSYLVILPKFDASKGERPYVAILTNKRDAYEEVLESGKYQVMTNAYFGENITDPNKVQGFVKDIILVSLGQAAIQGKDIKSVKKLWIESYNNAYEDLKARGIIKDEKNFTKAGKTIQSSGAKDGVTGDATIATASNLPLGYPPTGFGALVDAINALRLGQGWAVAELEGTYVTVKEEVDGKTVTAKLSSPEEVVLYKAAVSKEAARKGKATSAEEGSKKIEALKAGARIDEKVTISLLATYVISNPRSAEGRLSDRKIESIINTRQDLKDLYLSLGEEGRRKVRQIVFESQKKPESSRETRKNILREELKVRDLTVKEAVEFLEKQDVTRSYSTIYHDLRDLQRSGEIEIVGKKERANLYGMAGRKKPEAPKPPAPAAPEVTPAPAPAPVVTATAPKAGESSATSPDGFELTANERAWLGAMGVPNYRRGQIPGIRAITGGSFAQFRTGGGKTYVLGGSALIRFREKGERSLILTHEEALTEQAMIKDGMGEKLSSAGAVTGFILSDGKGGERGFIFEDGTRRDAKNIEEVYEKCAIIYSKWDRIVHRYMHERIGGAPAALSKNRYFTLFDEADLMLVFGAATPCIISGESVADWKDRLEVRQAVDRVVADIVLKDESLYHVRKDSKEVFLTPAGLDILKKALAPLASKSKALDALINFNFETFAVDAIKAHIFYSKDVQYAVETDKDGNVAKVIVIDEHTKALKPGMTFGEGLQQAIEISAGMMNITSENSTSLSMTIKHFLKDSGIVTDFAGASGTMEEEKFRAIYPDKTVVEISGEAAKLDKSAGHMGFAAREEKWQAMLESIRARMARNQPILVKVESDRETEELREFLQKYLSKELKDRGMIINATNGSNIEDFSLKIVQAGYANVITIATNMAHRGIDITIKGRYLNIDGTERRDALGAIVEVPPIGEKAPGLHVISAYLDEAEAFEIQTQGRADRGANVGSWEGLFSMDEKIFIEHAKLLDQQIYGLKAAMNAGAVTEELIRQVRERIVSEQNRNDERRREYEDEVFGYQASLLRVMDEVTGSAESFISFLKKIDAYDALVRSLEEGERLDEKLEVMRQVVRQVILKKLSEFQTEQQRTRNNISYMAAKSRVGISGVFIQIDQELISATRLARNFNSKIDDIGALVKAMIAKEGKEGLAGVQEIYKKPFTLSSSVLKVVGALVLILGVGILFSCFGIAPITAYVLKPLIGVLGGFGGIIAIATAVLSIPAVYLRQIYSGKLSQLDRSQQNFMRYAFGIGHGSFNTSALRWLGVMSLQLMAGVGLYASVGGVLAATVYPIILGLPVLPMALAGVILAIMSNLILMRMFKSQLDKAKDITPTRFQSGLNAFVRTIVIGIGILLAAQVSAGSAVFFGISIAAVLATSIVSIVIARNADEGYYRSKKVVYVGRAAGIVGLTAALAVAALLGAPAAMSIAMLAVKVIIGVIGVGVVLLQSFEALKMARAASAAAPVGKKKQAFAMAIFESFVPSSRNIIMYAIGIPAALVAFSGTVSAMAFVVLTIAGVYIISRYSVNIEKKIGRPLSEALTKALGGSMMMSAAVTPVVLYPQMAYSGVFEKLTRGPGSMGMMGMAADLTADTSSIEEYINAMQTLKEYPSEQFAGLARLGNNITAVLHSISNGTPLVEVAKAGEVAESEEGQARAPTAKKAKEEEKKALPEGGTLGAGIAAIGPGAGSPPPPPLPTKINTLPLTSWLSGNLSPQNIPYSFSIPADKRQTVLDEIKGTNKEAPDTEAAIV
ncbi:MAG: hypothetical protein NT036_03190, partial [Candidatus Omnitrophica bacterium]|nr:hypothetical protein [Candidatus Omnitrophota bacterium]